MRLAGLERRTCLMEYHGVGIPKMDSGMGDARLLAARRLDTALAFFCVQAEVGIRDLTVTGVQTCALPIFSLFVGVVFGLLLISAVNTAVVALIGVTYMMAQDGEMPPQFARLNTHGVPRIPLIVAVAR